MKTKFPCTKTTCRAARRNALRPTRVLRGFYVIAPCYENRLYGGPEEGGWYYDTHDFRLNPQDQAQFGQLAKPQSYRKYKLVLPDGKEVYLQNTNQVSRAKKLKAIANRVNRGEKRRSPSSVLSQGNWLSEWWVWFEVNEERRLPKFTPGTRPTYE